MQFSSIISWHPTRQPALRRTQAFNVLLPFGLHCSLVGCLPGNSVVLQASDHGCQLLVTLCAKLAPQLCDSAVQLLPGLLSSSCPPRLLVCLQLLPHSRHLQLLRLHELLLLAHSDSPCNTVPEMGSTLHEAMVVVLREFGGVMYSEDLARVIAERNLYRRDDGQHALAHQLRARAGRYPHLLEASDDGSGRIALAASRDNRLSDLVVFCADVGSVVKGRFGWARSESPGDVEEVHDASKPSDLVEAVCAELAASRPVALGFECPLFVPVPVDEMALGRARSGDGNRSWSAGAGTGALATGLVQAAWVLEAVRGRNTNEPLWLDWAAFSAVGHGLLVWEAFVTSTAKGVTHVDDAAIAVAAFTKALPDPRKASTISAARPLSVIGAAAVWSGWSMDGDVLHAAPLVVRAG